MAAMPASAAAAPVVPTDECKVGVYVRCVTVGRLSFMLCVVRQL